MLRNRGNNFQDDQGGGGGKRSRTTRGSPIGRGKRGTGMTCPGCSMYFPNLKRKENLIQLHMQQEERCRKYIIQCPNSLCNQQFLSQLALDRHVVRFRPCLVADKQMNKVISFPQTSVAFVDLASNDSINTDATAQSQGCHQGNYCVDLNNSSINFSAAGNQCLLYGLTDASVSKDPIVKITPQKALPKSKTKSPTPGCTVGNNVTRRKASTPQTMVNIPKKRSNVLTAREKRAMRRSQCSSSSGSDSSYTGVSESSSEASESGSEQEEENVSLDDLLADPDSGGADPNIPVNVDQDVSTTSRSTSTATAVTTHDNNSGLPSRRFMTMKENEEREKDLFLEDSDFKDGIELMNLLITKKISLHRYSDFMKWKHGTGYQFPSFEQVIKSATHKIYGSTLAAKMAPKISILQMPSGRSAPHVLFDTDAMIYDLISDTDMTSRKNMIFDPTAGNPFVVANSNVYADFETSTYFTEILKYSNFHPEKDVYFPIVLYIDELKLDAFGKLGLEPVVMSFMIYNRATRNLSQAWRVIGYMPNFGTMFGKKSYSADEKAEDYHFCMSKILDGIRNVQQNRNGHEWTFKFVDAQGNVSSHKRTLHFPLAYVIGDAKGNDLLCGRFGSHHNTKCVGRDCDAKTETCDDPSVRCNFLRMSKLKTMDKAELSNISFRKLSRNAFDGIWFGPQPYGINGCVPAEPLHQINLGILERLPAALFSRLSTALKCILDRHTGFICTHFYRQSDRSYPDISSFTSGISDAKRLTGREKLSRVFALYLVLLTQDFQNAVIGSMGRACDQDEDDDSEAEVMSVIDRNEYNTWVNVFEETLLLTCWIYLEEHPKVFFKGGRNSVAAKRIAEFVDMYRDSAPRTTGMGLKIVKFHQLLHLWWIIKLFGSLLNVDGARGESNAIVLTKQPGLCTQMRHAVLNVQTASETFKRNVILKCHKIIHTGSLASENVDNQNTPGDDDASGVAGSKFNVIFDYTKNRIVTKWTSPKMKSKLCMFPQNISGAVYDKLSHYNAGYVGKRIHKLQGFTEWKSKDPNANVKLVHTFRACPSFRSSRPWFDWAMIRWSTNEEVSSDIEGQLLMMLDMTTIVFEDCPVEEIQNNNLLVNTPHHLIQSLQVAFIHSAREDTKKDTSHTGRKSSVAFWSKMEGNYQMVDVQSIHRPCFVYVDKMNERFSSKYVPGGASEIISFLEKTAWSNEFLDYTNRDLTQQAETRMDNDVLEEELKPYET